MLVLQYIVGMFQMTDANQFKLPTVEIIIPDVVELDAEIVEIIVILTFFRNIAKYSRIIS